MARFALALALTLVFGLSSSLYADDEPKAASSLAKKAEQLREEGKPLEAIKLLNTALDKNPDDIDALLIRADCYTSAGDERTAITEYEHLLKLKPSGLRKLIIYNNLAYILAASSNDGIRDGKRAVDFAETAQLLQETPSPDVLDTLAAAYAEAGQYDRAIETENKAIKIAPEDQLAEFQKYQKLYEAHKPRREPPAKKDQPATKPEEVH